MRVGSLIPGFSCLQSFCECICVVENVLSLQSTVEKCYMRISPFTIWAILSQITQKVILNLTPSDFNEILYMGKRMLIFKFHFN